jgi:hypothetical protein
VLACFDSEAGRLAAEAAGFPIEAIAQRVAANARAAATSSNQTPPRSWPAALAVAGPSLLLADPLTHNHHHSRDLKCNACGPARPSLSGMDLLKLQGFPPES